MDLKFHFTKKQLIRLQVALLHRKKAKNPLKAAKSHLKGGFGNYY